MEPHVIWLLVVAGWFIALGTLAAIVWALARPPRAGLAVATGAAGDADARHRGLRRWLIVAGFRRPDAPQLFLAATLLSSLVGAVGTYLVYRSGAVAAAAQFLRAVPGGVGELALPAVYLSPWLALLVTASPPWLLVRGRRRRRRTEVEQDLPITLELLATLAEAGLGFDQALDRILRSQPAERTMSEEFRLFQFDLLAGRARIPSLRRLSQRVDVTAFTIFVSALVQAEQVGSGVADVLRSQAEDSRARRREEALMQASSLPVKLLFPLVLCFFPGIMVVTLGPIAQDFFRFSEGFVRTFSND